MPDFQPYEDDPKHAAFSPTAFHLSAVEPGRQSAVPHSVCSTDHSTIAETILLALAAAYPGHTIRIITTMTICSDERLALRMIAEGAGIPLDLV